MIFYPARLATEKAVFRPALPCVSLPGITEMQMLKLTYSEQLKHPMWQRKRLDRLNAAEFKCQVCSGDDRTLHVHHKQYIKGRLAWEYDDDNFAVLCEVCHEQAHAESDSLKSLLAKMPLEDPCGPGEVTALVAGFSNIRLGGTLVAHFEKNPEIFVIGEIAALLGMSAKIDELLEIHYFFANSGGEGRMAAIGKIVSLLRAENYASSLN
jgi:hypothetical protein